MMDLAGSFELRLVFNHQEWIDRTILTFCLQPAWDVVITMYAIYHLIRPAKDRTPSSSGSYHFFALFMDAGLIPFYIFIALYANQNYNLKPDAENRWTSFFSTNFATTTVIYVTFIGTIVMAALHLVSISIDLYLIVMFRKIANLPPDMNPLEDNLTGSTRRSRSQRHKHKNSEMSTASTLTGDMTEKKMGYYSGSTLDVTDSRLSTAKEPEARTIPFGHSRMDSDYSYSPHNPNSARWSRQQQQDEISLYQGPYSARSSRHDVGAGHRSRAGSVVNSTRNTDVVDFAEVPPVPPMKNPSRPTTAHQDSFVSSRGTPDRMSAAPTKDVVKSQQKQGLLNDNWYVLDDEAVSDLGSPRRRYDAAPPYSQNPTLPQVELDQIDRHDSFEHQPLKMNPPTPPPQIEYPSDNKENDTPYNNHRQSNYYENYSPIETGVARTLTVASHNTAGSSVYSESAPPLTNSTTANGRPNNGTPKGKYYGDLATATRNIRGAVPLGQTQFPDLSPKKSGRVISRTGADITDVGLYASEQSGGYGLRGRRDVSGKIAEEGRGGAWR